MVFKAIGQVFVADPLRGEVGRELLVLKDGRISADTDGRTSLDGVWAGGDCVAGGDDLTVAAVAAGRRSAEAITQSLRRQAAARTEERRVGHGSVSTCRSGWSAEH